MTMRIALDAMGGDYAPQSVLKGAKIALERNPHLHFLLFGPAKTLKPLLARSKKLAQASEIIDCESGIPADMKPSTALRQGRGTSMWQAIDAVHKGQAQAVVSAGNTGALMVLARFILKMLPGVDRPAIASFFPTMRGESVMLDLGANLECSGENLAQFAVMGQVFAKTVLGFVKPTIGLLNVGSEDMKGSQSIRDAATTLKESSFQDQFYGFVEGNNIAEGIVDVIVADGFAGNIALKASEGAAKMISTFTRQAFKNSIWAKLGYLLARRTLSKLHKRMDPRRYNGAVLLGVNGTVVKSHGRADALGFATAIGVAVDMVKYDYQHEVCHDINRLKESTTSQEFLPQAL